MACFYKSIETLKVFFILKQLSWTFPNLSFWLNSQNMNLKKENELEYSKVVLNFFSILQFWFERVNWNMNFSVMKNRNFLRTPLLSYHVLLNQCYLIMEFFFTFYPDFLLTLESRITVKSRLYVYFGVFSNIFIK